MFNVLDSKRGVLMGMYGKPYEYATRESAQESADQWNLADFYENFEPTKNRFQVVPVAKA